MKKGVNLLWIIFVVINALILMISLLDCVKYIPTHYEGLAIMEDGLYAGFDGPIALPEPSFRNLFRIVWFESALCSILFLLKPKVLHIIGIILSLFQSICVIFYVRIVSMIEVLFDDIGCAIGELHGKYELTSFGILLGFLCFASFIYSIILTILHSKDKNQRLTNKQE